MKRDMDVVRDVLHQISAAPEKPSSSDLVKGKAEDDANRVLYHIELLCNAGFVTGISSSPLNSDYKIWSLLDLTWQGHEFADAVRSPEVWRKTKEGVNKVGSWTLDLVVELAKTYAKQVAREKLGFNVA
jgi:hypothetical protein